MSTIAISFIPERKAEASQLSDQLQLPIACSTEEYDYFLHLQKNHLELISCQQKHSPLYVDFLSGSNWHRYRYGGGINQLISKACGIKKNNKPNITDLTGGLARDAFVLATLGCHVTLLERHPVIAALVADALQRAQQSPALQSLSLSLVEADAFDYLQQTKPQQTEVIYLDPMYPDREKSALVKKEMRILRDIVGNDGDSADLLDLALQCAIKRVVVKRPYHAKPLSSHEPSLSYNGKSARFDVYLC